MLYLLDKDVKTVKWNGIPLHEASSAIVKEEINGDFVLTVHYPITDTGIYRLIKEDMLIKASVPVLGAQLFRIKKPIENDDNLDITAYHVSDDIMKRSINPLSVVGQGCAMALSQMVQNAKTDLGTFSFTSDIMDSRTYNTTETETLYSVLLDGKHSIVGTWEGELVRDNFALTIKRSRGADRGVVITTHKNLKSYQRTKNSQGVVTRIHARSTFKPDGAEDEVTLRVTVDSPLINSYPYINEKEYENNNAETVEDLRKWAEAKFTNEGIDKVSDAIEIEAYELDGQVVHLGDTVNIKSRKHDVDLYKKAIAYEYNALTEEYISITFDDKPGVGGSGVSSGVSNAADVILTANRNAQEVAIERAVRNANLAFDAEFDKRSKAINDAIEQSKADAEVYADKVRQDIAQDLDDFEREYRVNKQLQDQQVADILSTAHSSASLATDAKSLAERSKAESVAEATRLVEMAKSATDAKMQSIDINIDTIKNQLATKVSQMDFDAVNNRLTSAETSIVTQAGQIEQRLTRAQAEQLLSDKGFATTTTVQNIVRETADSFNRTISETKALIPTDFNSRNLVQNGAFPTEINPWTGDLKVHRHDFYYRNGKTLFVLDTDQSRELFAKTNRFELKRNTDYTLSFYGFASWNVSSMDVNFYGRKNSDSNDWTHADEIISSKRLSPEYAEYVTVTFNSGDNDNGYLRFDHNGSNDGSMSWLFFAEVMLVEGVTAQKWEPAFEELITETKFHDVRDTIDSHTRTIGDQANAISQVVQTAQGLVTRVNDMSSYFNLIYDPTNYTKYKAREPESNLALVGTNDYKLLRITQTGRTSNGWRGYQMPMHSNRFTAGEKLSYRVSIWVDRLPDAAIGFEIKNNWDIVAQFFIQPTRTGSNQIFTGTFTVNKSIVLTDEWPFHVWVEKNGIVAIGQLSVVRGDIPPTSFVDSTSSMLLATQTQVNTLAGSWSVQNLNGAGDILSQANLSSSQFLLEAAKIRLKGKTLADEIQAIDGKFGTLFVADGTFGKLNANVISAQSITGAQIKFDQSFFNYLSANEAYLKQIFAKNAFITQVQSVTLSASKISGGILTATNRAMEVNLNAGQIMYYTDQAALKRILNGYPTQFVKFATGTITGKGNAGVTVIGSNRWNSESSNDGGFVGIRAWNGNDIDMIDVVGDTVRLASSAYDNSDGWEILTTPGNLRIDAHRASDRPSSRLNIGDIHLFFKDTNTYFSLKDILTTFNKSIRDLGGTYFTTL
ncbi:phage tail spike protein [Streptococcus plurextorum]|uniref:phage tail spike protein n=1 Tax=Streptococcus plurextorum TaxID=456876 RepID=UPI000409D949|nr:phage tail spike protein [Streptococcus plurextorum]